MASVARPRRGRAENTKRRLVEAAAREFNVHGYHGTDSNRIARAAGYSPGTFYNHFTDKAAVFAAAYENWVGEEWRSVYRKVGDGPLTPEAAVGIVEVLLDFHDRWAVFRGSLRALASVEDSTRDAYRRNRRQQLERLARMRASQGTQGSPEGDAVLMFALERGLDAIAEGEAMALGLARERMVAELANMIVAHFRVSDRASLSPSRLKRVARQT